MIYPPLTYPPPPDEDDFDERLDGQREIEREADEPTDEADDR